LLIAILTLLLVYPVTQSLLDTRLIYDLLLTAVFLASIRMLFRERRYRVPAWLLGAPTLVGTWTDYVVPGLSQKWCAAGFHFAAAVFLLFAVATILRAIYEGEEISSDSIFGGLCGYLLVGLAFGHLYCLIDSVVPNSFHCEDGYGSDFARQDQRHFVLTYFSFVTLTTLGYGDVRPTGGTARGLAAVEAVAGQFYVAVLVAELVGMKVAQAVADRSRTDR
jgi:hypothetical protein